MNSNSNVGRAFIRARVVTLAAVFTGIFFLFVNGSSAEVGSLTIQKLVNAAMVPGTMALKSTVIEAIDEQPEEFSEIISRLKEIAPKKLDLIIPGIRLAFPGFTEDLLAPEVGRVRPKVESAQRFETTLIGDKFKNDNRHKWSGEMEVGGSTASGNTDTERVAAAIQVVHSRGSWKDSFNANYDTAREDSETFSRRLFAETESRYFLNDTFLFTFLSGEDDRFSAFDYQLSQSVGIGHSLIMTNNFQVDLEIGPGARQSRLKDTQEFEMEYTGRLVSTFRWNISGTQKLVHKTAATVGDVRTLLETKTTYTGDMNSDLALRIGIEVRHNTEVPATIRKTDTISRITLVYRFGQ